ncbi:Tuberin-Rap/ran-GTPase-activating protein [Phaffia rhodozyma]|uniref:Tuberin-Rap/ran-GTPase-activating protein n=1 Tax=Phaffia rhodozyma TaxID=264483 RepID=A0A0F7SYF7_PHARH|nr:Tuberin-Rap/ran-GTPase-activating protein [Phaffia rhodozyma]
MPPPPSPTHRDRVGSSSTSSGGAHHHPLPASSSSGNIVTDKSTTATPGLISGSAAASAAAASLGTGSSSTRPVEHSEPATVTKTGFFSLFRKSNTSPSRRPPDHSIPASASGSTVSRTSSVRQHRSIPIQIPPTTPSPASSTPATAANSPSRSKLQTVHRPKRTFLSADDIASANRGELFEGKTAQDILQSLWLGSERIFGSGCALPTNDDKDAPGVTVQIEDGRSMELQAKALTDRILDANVITDLFPLFISADSPAVALSSLPSANMPSNIVIDNLLKVINTFCDGSHPLALRLAGFNLLYALLSKSPPSYLSPLVLAAFLRIILCRPVKSKAIGQSGILDPAGLSFSVEEIQLKVACMRALLLGGKTHAATGKQPDGLDEPKPTEREFLARDGWDWSEIVSGLKAWAEELAVAWSMSVAVGSSPGEYTTFATLGLIQSGSASKNMPVVMKDSVKANSSQSTRLARQNETEPPSLESVLLDTLDLLSFIIHKKGSLLTPNSLQILMALFGRLAWQGLDVTAGLRPGLSGSAVAGRPKRRRASEYERTVALSTGEEKDETGSSSSYHGYGSSPKTTSSSPINLFPPRGRAGFSNSATYREAMPSSTSANSNHPRSSSPSKQQQQTTQTRHSRSPSVSGGGSGGGKAPSTTSTSNSFAKSYTNNSGGPGRSTSNVTPAQTGLTTAFSPPAASLPLPSLTSAAALSSAISSSASNTGGAGGGGPGTYAPSSTASTAHQGGLSTSPVHPLARTLLRLLSTLTKKLPHMLSDEILLPASRIMFAMMTLGGESEKEAWKALRELFGKGFSGRFGTVLEQVLAGSVIVGKKVETWDEPDDWEIGVVRGAVKCIRSALSEAYSYRKAQSNPTGPSDMPESASSLYASAPIVTLSSSFLSTFDLSTFSTRLISGMALNRCKNASDEERERWMPIDLEVLLVLDDVLESAADKGMDRDLGEGDLVVKLLGHAKGWVERFRYPDGKRFTVVREMELHDASKSLDCPDILNLFGRLCRILPRRLVTYVNHGRATSAVPSLRLPRGLALLLLDLPANISQPATILLIEHYRTEDLCIPTCIGWLDNLDRLSHVVFIAQPSSGRDYPEARKDMAKLLFQQVYSRIKDVAEDRQAFLERVVLPLLEVTLEKEKDEDVEKAAWEVLIDGAVVETLDQDDGSFGDEDVQAVEGSPLAGTAEGGLTVDVSSDLPKLLFERIRQLIVGIACLASASSSFSSLNNRAVGAFPPPSRLYDAIGMISPLLSPEGSIADMSSLPSFSLLPASSPSGSSTPVSASDIPQPTKFTHSPLAQTPPTPPPASKSFNACLALVTIFIKITFRPQIAAVQRVPLADKTIRSIRSITLFESILDLLRPHMGSSISSASRTGSPARRNSDFSRPNMHASCPRARLLLLQWLLHLRADTRHRLLVTSNIDASHTASLLGRNPQMSDKTPAPDPAEARRGRGGRYAAQAESSSSNDRMERGRNPTRDRDRSRPGNASRSRSRLPEMGSSRDIIQNPLWFFGESLAFELSNMSIGSFGLNTFDPQRAFVVGTGNQSLIPRGIWLPVSEYLKVLIEILNDEREWELVSYLLCYFPAQLSNQHFFCGPRAKEQLGRLLDGLCGWLGPGGSLPISKNLPIGVRKADLRAVAYQSLDVLISYHRQFGSQQHSALIRAFHTGVSATGSTESTGKACIHALTMAIDELVLPLAKELPSILSTLSALTSNVSLSIHILEFLYCVSYKPKLYSNFTPQQYELVFAVILNIITTHHESVTVPPGADATAAQRTAAVLSQHMLQLAYLIIYSWFLFLPASQRPRFIPFITKKLMQAKRSPQDTDKRSEVCVDFLHRYAYANADPKPAPSFLGDLVLPDLDKDPSHYDEKSWVIGTSIIKVTTDKLSGWCKIDTIRPSGSTSIVAKLENVPFIGLGNDGADLVSLAAVLVGDQNPRSESDDQGEETTACREEISQAVLTTPVAPSNPKSADPDFVWSGVVPSQRRKEVWVDPSFVASQFCVYPLEPTNMSNSARLVTDAGSLRTIKNMDVNNPPVDIQQVAVLYVGAGQTKQEEILSNVDGSENYTRFLHRLGRVVKLRDQKDIPTGLDTSDEAIHGTYTYAWWDDLAILAFHVATLMPNLPLNEGDRPYLNKSAPIGNDHVRVVFNDSGQDYAFDTLKTDFQFCNIVISPHSAGTSRTHDNPDEHNFFKVTIQRVEGLPEFGPVGQFKIVSATALPSFIRLLAQMADMICKNYKMVIQGFENTTSWRNRLRLIDRIRDLAIARDPEIPKDTNSAIIATSDFTLNLQPKTV